MFNDHDLNLLQTKGYQSIKTMLEEWSIIKHNMQTTLDHAKLFLPNYFFIADPGVGLSYITALISEHLYDLGMMPFSNVRKSIEFMLDYEESREHFKSFERLHTLLEHGLSQYGLPFAGVLVIHITEWIEKGAYHDKRFIRFLEYLTKRDDIQMIILVSECKKETNIKEAESIISSKIRIKTLRIETSPSEELLERMLIYIKAFGLTVDPTVKPLLLQTIDKAVKNPTFNGIETIKNLAKDIIYEKYRQHKIISPLITLEDVTPFKPNGPWLKQLSMHL